MFLIRYGFANVLIINEECVVFYTALGKDILVKSISLIECFWEFVCTQNNTISWPIIKMTNATSKKE